jgi:hypothetical protein
MAQTGFTPISLYSTTTASAVPLAANLVAGEVALNTTDGKMYFKNTSGVVTALASATALTDPVINSLNGGQLAGMRNRIINGDMRIDQRNSGANYSSPAGAISINLIDRWQWNKNTAALVCNFGQQASTVPGFKFGAKYQISTAATPATSESNSLIHKIEGFNVSDLAWGTTAAKTCTLSFWFFSAITTGLFGGSIRNGGSDRSYPFTFTIPTAATWTYVSIVIPGDTTGTWITDTGIGINIAFDMGSGASTKTTAGAWAAGNFLGATGTVIPCTVAQTVSVTGVQFELGSVATPFEQRPYGLELGLCQRYYQIARADFEGYMTSPNQLIYNYALPVVPRVAPTVATLTTGTLGGVAGTPVVQISDLAFISFTSTVSSTGAGFFVGYRYSLSAEL